MNIHCYATMKAKEPLQEYSYEPDTLGPYDIEVDITHCGICHSDLHLIDNDWNVTQHPLVPGHEIIGTITDVGQNIVEVKKGQRVGIGWQRSSCMHCKWCHQGEENQCLKQEATCVGHNGGFAQKIRTDGRFAFAIPDKLPSEQAAPLLCGGATVFSPLLNLNIKPTHKVGVIGIGGLGHLALQFAHAFGCEVTAFSHTPEKEKEAKELGAHHFVSTQDDKALKKLANSLDFIICTISQPLDWNKYLQVLQPKGTLCFVGAQSQEIKLDCMTLITGRKCVCASNIGSRPDIKEMLDFAALHDIKAQVEVFPMSDVNTAIDRVRKGDVRYRAVLKN